MQLSSDVSRKLEELRQEFGDLNLNSNDVPETIHGIGQHLILNGRGAIPIAVTMITNGLALFLTECQGDYGLAIELFDIVAKRAKAEAAK